MDTNKEINYGFLSLLIPKEKEKEIILYSKQTMQDAANSLQWHIYNGLVTNLKKPIKIFNILPIGSFPQYYKKLIIKSEYFSTQLNENINIGFFNFKFFKKYFQFYKAYKEIDKWCKESNQNKILFVYTINSTFMQIISRIKKKYKNVTICAIVADLPNMISLQKKKSLVKRIYEQYNFKVSYRNLQYIDFYVLLTKYMADYLNIDKPYCIIEGISTNLSNKKKRKREKHILYSGTLHKRFGILNLLKAFERIEDPEYRLYICGVGDSEKEIIDASKKDSRIIFLGQISRTEVFELQQIMAALVNPRQNIEEFTKYSFPSKNIEYLSSGVPLIAYKLDGIPDDYDDYINYVKDNSVNSLVQCIKMVCEDKTGIIDEKARKGQEYVLIEKNELKQTSKILNLMGIEK